MMGYIGKPYVGDMGDPLIAVTAPICLRPRRVTWLFLVCTLVHYVVAGPQMQPASMPSCFWKNSVTIQAFIIAVWCPTSVSFAEAAWKKASQPRQR